MFRRALLFAAVVFGCAAGPPPKRPKVDLSAMQEAMNAASIEEDFASSASYAHYLQSRLRHQEGDSKKAIEELRLALATDGGNPFLLTALAEEYARASDLPRAEVELKKVISLHGRYQPAQLLLGRVLYEGRKFSRAQIALRKAIKLRPRDPDAYLVLAQLFVDTDQPEQAVKVVDQLGRTLPGEASGYRRLGLALAEKGDFDRAEPLLLRASERDPGDFDVWVMLAQLYEGTKRPAKAEEAYDEALERDPDNREVLLQAGRLSLKTGSTVRARAYFDRLLSLSDDPELAVKVAFSYLATRQLDEAAEVLDASRAAGLTEPRLAFYAGLVHEKLRHFPKAAEAYGAVPADSDLFHEARLHQASCLSLAGQHARAAELFKKGVAEKPDYVLLYPAYARALERAGNDKEAEALLRRAVQKYPAAELFDELSQMLEKKGRLAEAIDLIGQALASHPRDEALLYTLGAAYERKGDHEKSISEMRQVLEVNPENPDAMNFIGYTLAESGHDLDEAERLLNKALELRPDNGAFLDSLGWVYYQKGEADRAVKTLERATQLSPGEPLIIEHLGDAYQRAARPQDAEKAYQRALEVIHASPEVADDPKAQQRSLERKLKVLSSGAASR
ncbi:MAG TPA: tetratricopeptide repeat protein [Myxococcaceae bacterium]|nr:tetratricopeptide repeat protein [Myxococcaceae bacterium]